MLTGHTPECGVLVDNNANAYINFGGGINVVDPYTGRVRQSTKADLAASARLCDALKEVSVYSRAVYPLDQPQKLLHLHTAERIRSIVEEAEKEVSVNLCLQNGPYVKLLTRITRR